jgi:pimeloyl-ACP methyl ester carboxylesterase
MIELICSILNRWNFILPYETLKFIRPFVKLSSLVAPRSTGNFAFRIFCKPPSVKNIDAKQKQLIQTAQDRMKQATIERIAFDGGEVQTYMMRSSVRPSRGTILLLHGWSGRAAFMSIFVDPLLEAGFDVLSVDLPGHGESAGHELHIPLALTALDAVHARFGPFYGTIAHSFGGAVALAMSAGAMERFTAVDLKRLVLIAIPHSVPELFTWFSQVMGLTKKGSFWLEENVRRLSGHPLSSFEGLDQLRKLKIPTLVMHAPDDKEVDYRSAEILASAGDFVTLKPMPRLGHRRILYAKETALAATAFMAS